MKWLTGLVCALVLAGCTLPGVDMPAPVPLQGSDVLVAVGSGGMIARSLDHGETWSLSMGVSNPNQYQNKIWNGGKTNLHVDGDITLSGELNRGLIANLNAASAAVSAINDTGFIGDLHVRGTVYQGLGSRWVGLITNPFGASVIYSVAYGNGVFVAVGAGGKIARSTDYGVTWGALIANPFGGNDIRSVAYGNGVFVAAGVGCDLARSTDYGVTWGALIANPFGGGTTIYSVAYGNGVFVATTAFGQIARSIDYGATWGSLIANPFGNGIFSVAYGNGVFVATTAFGQIARSIDYGVTWGALIANPFGGNDIYSVAYGNGVFVATTAVGQIARSIDYGATWGSLIANPFGGNSIRSVAYNFGIFQAGSGVGTTARSYDNGVTWGSIVTNPFGANIIYSIASSDTNMVAVGQGGSIATAGWNAAYSLVEPVPGEPSLGTPKYHPRQYSATDFNNPNVTAQTFYVATLTGMPTGAKAAFITGYTFGGAAGADCRWRPYGSSDTWVQSVHRALNTQPVAGGYAHIASMVLVDPSGRFEIGSSANGSSVFIYGMVFYWI